MRRALEPAPGDTPSVDLRALKAVVLGALNELGLTLITPPPVVGGPSIMWSQATSSGRANRPKHRAHPNLSSLPAARSGSGEDANGGSGRASHRSQPAAMADEHAEIWEIVSRAQAGDGDAFAQLYDRYVDTVFRFIYFRVNDRALAEDFTSETFLRALRRIATIKYQGRDIGAWFVTIARNIILDHVKSARNRLEITTGETVEGNQTEPSPEAAVIDLLTSERLMAAVKQLRDKQRECVTLRFIQGFSVSETAAAMGKNDGAIKALQHRAVRKLAELVGGELR